MPIVLDSNDLLHGRVKAVQVMLKPLGQPGKPVPCMIVSRSRNMIICGHSGSKGQDYTDKWFPICASGIQGQYHEIWYPQNNEQKWWMERAYFSLRKVERIIMKTEEILCIHSDPMCKDTEPLGLYKKGPHLHISVAKSPISHAHFPLNLGHLEQVLASCDDLSRAISLALQVIRDEVVKRF